MGVLEGSVVTLGASQQFYGRYPSGWVWGMVVQMNGIIHGQRPQGLVILLRPVDGRVNHLGSGFVY